MTSLEYEELAECIARMGVDKYKPVKEMGMAAATKGMILNLIGDKSTEAVLSEATLIRCDRFDWRRGSNQL
eukprot:4420068-Prymnesium_polylepis.1